MRNLGQRKEHSQVMGCRCLALLPVFQEEVCIYLTSRGSTLGIPTSEVAEFICLPHGQPWDAFHLLLDHSWTKICS